MPDISVNSAEVYTVSGRVVEVVAGEAITKGQAVALDTDNKYYLADNNSGTAARKKFSGVAIDTASGNGRPIRVQKSGTVYLGGLVTKGGIYVVSASAGGIAPYTDLATGNRVILAAVGGPGVYEVTLIRGNSSVDYP